MRATRAAAAAWILIGCVVAPSLASAQAKPTAASAAKPGVSMRPTAEQIAAADKARHQAAVGLQLLEERAIEKARAYCEEALKTDPAQQSAVACLRQIAQLERENLPELYAAQEQALLAEIEARRRNVDDAIIQTLATARGNAKTAAELDGVARAFARARPTTGSRLFDRVTASWVFDVAFGLLVIPVAYVALVLARRVRRLWRTWKIQIGHVTVGGKRRQLFAPVRLASTRWLFTPLDDQTQLGINALVLDAIHRMRRDLEAPLNFPTLVPLRPTRGERYEPEVWKDFRVDPPRQIRELEQGLKIELQQNDIDLAAAIGKLQIKLGTGVDFAGIAAFLGNVSKWFDVGLPTIGGAAFVSKTDSKSDVTVQLTRCADTSGFAGVIASTEHESAAEAARLASERAAYKLLYLFAKPTCSQARVDGLAARRQGISLLQRHIGSGDDSGSERRLGLEKAVFNLRFARAALAEDKKVACELHLFDGIAEALLGNTDSAIELFRTVRDIADLKDPEEVLFRLQALYNNAVVEHRPDLALRARKADDAAAVTNAPVKPTRDGLGRAIQIYERLLRDHEACRPALASALEAAVERETADQVTTRKFLQPLDEDAPRPLTSAEVQRAKNAADTVAFLGRVGLLVASAQWAALTGDLLEEPMLTRWLKDAEELIADKEGLFSGVEQREQSVIDVVLVETHRAYISLALIYIKRFRSDVVKWPPVPKADLVPVTATDPDAASPLDSPMLLPALRGLIARVMRSLDALMARQSPDLPLYKCLVLTYLAGGDVLKAERFALQAINVGGTDQVFFYAAAIGVIYRDIPEAAITHLQKYEGAEPKTAAFTALEKYFEQRAKGVAPPPVERGFPSAAV
jgi:tetratricopeptide (TPR) repeat protein